MLVTQSSDARAPFFSRGTLKSKGGWRSAAHNNAESSNRGVTVEDKHGRKSAHHEGSRGKMVQQ